MERLKKSLAIEFEVKDLGTMRYFLGMEIARSRKGFSVPQRKYILDLLIETGMLGCKSSDTPMEAGKKSEDVGEPMETDRAPQEKGLFFKKSERKEVEVFTDTDWAGSVKDRRSTTGYCTYVWGNLVTWKNKKQSVVARSSTEAEFIAIAQGICEGL
ncbi:uncharacterized protein LOC111412729 [Olea europaea var. sylvestris]|uniref:uncharacterized protein LOC111412729 n=1 Tax=Olea europaea var. sylvestris TaxID=158386 RepID=UPI000C1D6707|nr:uncharacterized protein LOC111412729 [Olea europaea var. sylvestris]